MHNLMTGHTIALPNGGVHERSDEDRRAVRPADGGTRAADDPGGRDRVAAGGVATLACDLETYSACDLKAAGLHNYATDKTSGIHCFSWGSDPFEISTWLEGQPFPEELREHLARGGILTAWNAPFEFHLINECGHRRYGWPKLRIEQIECSMAMAYAMSLPGALEKASAALGVEQRKDMAGARIMMQLAQPKADGTMWRPEHDPEKFQRLYDYNRQDVRTELAARERLMRLSPQEQRLWRLDAKINAAGIQVDLPSIDAAIALVESEKKRLNAEMLKATQGVVGSCTEIQLLVKWIRLQGIEVKGLAKADVLDALKIEDMPAVVRKALLLRQEAAKSSTAKLVAMKQRASADGRVRGTKQYHGASTGRWAGRGMQTDNYIKPRPGIESKHTDDMIAHLHDRAYLDMMYGPVMDALADMLRPMITATPGKDLVAVDFSNIEGRVLAWLAGEEWKLQAFRDFDTIVGHNAKGEPIRKGPDLYLIAASKIYHRAASEFNKKSPEREVGKRCELAFGFGGGVGAWRKFETYATKDYVPFPDDQVNDIKNAWRGAHTKLTGYWHDLESAAMNAVIYPGTPCKSGPGGRQVVFKKNGSFLWCKLPSGRVLCYPYPTIKPVQTPWGEMKDALHFWTVNGTTNKWEETSTYGGSLAENVTQAVARDLLAEALVRVDAAGYAIVGHVHDELIAEVPSGAPSVEKIETLMCVVPSWATGLPVAAEGWQGRRYRK